MIDLAIFGHFYSGSYKSLAFENFALSVPDEHDEGEYRKGPQTHEIYIACCFQFLISIFVKVCCYPCHAYQFSAF